MNGAPRYLSAAGFEAARARFEAARRVPGALPCDYSIDGVGTFRLLVADERLIPLLTPALEHLRVGPLQRPELTVCAWTGPSGDLAPSTLESLPAPGPGEPNLPVIWAGNGTRLTCMDLAGGLALHWVSAPDVIPVHERGAPLLQVLHWWARARGHAVVHAGAVGSADGGVLLVGKGGVGKSTSALASVACGLLYAADDYCLLTGGAEPAVRSLYNTAKVNGGRLAELTHLHGARPQLFQDDKAVLWLYATHPTILTGGFPLRAVLAVSATGRPHTDMRPSTAAEALRAVAPSSILQLKDGDARDLRFLADLVRRLPCFTLEAGTDLGRIGPAIEALLAAVRRTA